MDGSRNKTSKSRKNSSWKALGPSKQASFDLEVMLGNMEKENGQFQKAAHSYLKALKIFFHPDVYKNAVQAIDNLPLGKQNTFLYELGKILLIHCQQAELAHETLDKLSILDPSFLKPVQNILLKYNGKQAPVFKHIRSILNLTNSTKTRQAKSPKHKKVPAKEKATSGEKSSIDSEIQLSLQEPGEQFLIKPEAKTIDKTTLNNLMDSLLTEDDSSDE